MNAVRPQEGLDGSSVEPVVERRDDLEDRLLALVAFVLRGGLAQHVVDGVAEVLGGERPLGQHRGRREVRVTHLVEQPCARSDRAHVAENQVETSMPLACEKASGELGKDLARCVDLDDGMTVGPQGGRDGAAPLRVVADE